MNRPILTVLAALALAGCSSCTPLPPPAPAPSPEPTPDPPDPPPAPEPTTDALARACGHLRELGCPGGGPTAAGTPCETVLRDTQASGVLSFDLECLATIPSCSAQAGCARQPGDR